MSTPYFAHPHDGEGPCASCFSFDKRKWYLDLNGHMVCEDCLLVSDVDRKVYCRQCVEATFGSKNLAKTLIGIIAKMPPDRLFKHIMIPRGQLIILKNELVQKGLIVEKETRIFQRLKPTWLAWPTARTFYNAYKNDLDFQMFFTKAMEGNEKWKELMARIAQ